MKRKPSILPLLPLPLLLSGCSGAVTQADLAVLAGLFVAAALSGAVRGPGRLQNVQPANPNATTQRSHCHAATS